jgi:hypothetical protein
MLRVRWPSGLPALARRGNPGAFSFFALDSGFWLRSLSAGAVAGWLGRRHHAATAAGRRRSMGLFVVPEARVGGGWALGTLRRVRPGWRRYLGDPSAGMTVMTIA